MNCSRTDWQRQIDFSAVRDLEAINRAILRRFNRRKTMREKEICRWFHATPAATVEFALVVLTGRGEVERRTLSRHDAYEYSLEPRP